MTSGKTRLFKTREILCLAVLTVTACALLGGLAVWLDLAGVQRAFRDRADSFQRDLAHQFGSMEAVLTALVGLHHASDNLKTYEFAALAQELTKSYPHIRTIAVARVLPLEERERFELQMRQDGFLKFRVTERGVGGTLTDAAPRPRSIPIRMFEPMEPELAGLIGFDVVSEPVLDDAIRRAVRTGRVVASDPLELPLVGRGVVAFKAIYLGHNQPRSERAREQQLSGLVALILEPTQFFRDFEETYPEFSFELATVAQGDDGGEALVFTHSQPEPAGLSRFFGAFDYSVTIAALGKQFVVRMAKTPSLETLRPWYIALFVSLGALLSALAIIVFVHRRSANARAREGERILRENQERFRDYAEIASDWFWSTDAGLRFDYFSKRFPISAEFRPTTLVGDRESGDNSFAPDAAERTQHLDDLETRRAFKDVLYRYVDGEGHANWWRMSGKPVIDETGAFIGYRGTGRDVTAAIEVHQSLQFAKDQAELANRAKSEFIANMSHELRTPLNAIIGFSEIMKHQALGPLGDKKYAEYAADIHDSGHHLLSLINDILDLSKVESGNEELHEEEIVVAQMVQSLMTLMRHHAEKGGVALFLELDSRLPPLVADKRKLKQILVNLLSNAVKFTKAGGRVTLKAWCDRQTGFVFQVADTGIGIAPEDIPKAFQKFRQIDSDLNRKYEGTGLGLPLAKSLALLHGGDLTMESEKGRGTTVTVTLPASRIVQVQAEPAPEAPVVPIGALRVG